MTNDLIPRKDGEFNTFQDLLIAKITLHAVAWGVPAGEVTAGTALQTIWTVEYNKVLDPDTKTATTVKGKKTARFKYLVWMRPFLQRYIVVNPLVTDAERISLGIVPRDKTRTRVPVPTTTVQLDLLSGNGNTVKVGFRQEADSNGNTHRGKPAGVTHCEFAFKVDAPAPVSAADCVNRKVATRSPLVIGFAPEQAGKRLYVFARWLNTKDEEGPWTPVPASIVIPG